MENSDLPALFQVADKGAINAQNSYLNLVRLEIAALILAAISSNVSLELQTWPSILSKVSFVSLIVAFVARILNGLIGFDEKWFDCRAIAESVKSAAWRYITRATPFNDPDQEEVDKEFLKDVKLIRDSRKKGAKMLGKEISPGKDITKYMREFRGKPLSDRKSLYNEERVEDQKEWYCNKARGNQDSKNMCFWWSVVLEGLAVIIAYFMIGKGAVHLNITGILIILVAVIVVWTQTKRHSELSQSYSLVAQDLSRISSTYIHINNEDKFSVFVDEVEEEISKEHTMWLARREL